MKFPDARILVFAKAPVPGQCKTRLISALGTQGAATLHQQLISRTLETTTHAQLCPVELWCAPSEDHPFFHACQEKYSITLHQQEGENLGQRMYNAMRHTLHYCSNTLLIGCDCPGLTKIYLKTAIETLSNGSDVVIGPAKDGGYVLIGLKKAFPALFSHINWGSDQVITSTRQRLKQLQLSWQELATQRDIDRPEDLIHLPTNIHPYRKE